MKKIFGTVVIIIVVLFSVVVGKMIGGVANERLFPPKKSAVSEQAAFSENSFLTSLATDANKRLPMRIDAETRADTIVAGPGRKFSYVYTLVNHKAASVDAQQFHRAHASTIKANVCASKKMQVFFRNNVAVSYYYRGSDGAFITEINILPADCGYRFKHEYVAPPTAARKPLKREIIPHPPRQYVAPAAPAKKAVTQDTTHKPTRQTARSLCDAGFSQACQ